MDVNGVWNLKSTVNKKRIASRQDKQFGLRRTKYGKKDKGLWLVGFYQDSNNIRFVEVENRKGPTLMELFEKYLTPHSVVVTDEWGGYNKLKDYGYVNESVSKIMLIRIQASILRV